MPSTPPIEVAVPRFAEACTGVLDDLSKACAALLDTLDQPIRRAVDLERELELDKKLAWQVFKIGRTSHAIAGGEGLNLPTRTGIQRLAKAAQRRGVRVAVVKRLTHAFDAFESFVAEHAGDRESFHTMLGSLAGAAGGGEGISEKHRMAMYRAASHLWGVRTDATIRCEIFFPKPTDCIAGASDQPGASYKLDSAAIHGCRNLHRLRHDAHLAIEVGAYERGTASDDEHPVLLADFCETHGLGAVDAQSPAARWTAADLGRMRLEVPDLGRAAAASFYILKTNRPSPDAPRLNLSTGVAISMPTALTVVDLMVPVGLTDPGKASVTVYGSRSEYPFPKFDPIHVLPHREHVSTTRAVKASEVPIVPELPRYTEAVAHVLQKLGWDGVRFDHYRCRVAYPYFHTHIWLRADEV